MADPCSSCGGPSEPNATIPRNANWRGPEEPLCERCFRDLSCIEVRSNIRRRRKAGVAA